MYAQDSKGMGHITRSQTIARHLLAANPHCVAYIATESPVVGRFDLPDRCDYVKLPKRQAPDGYIKTPAEEDADKDFFRDIRSRILKAVALSLLPDLVIVDHVPLGYRGEFRDGLLALQARQPKTRFVLGLRDIQDDPNFTRTQWQGHGEYDALERLYDAIVVYSHPGFFDVAEAYGIPPSARHKVHYVGHIIRDPPEADPRTVRRDFGLHPTDPLVVATVGSGFDGFPVLEAAQAAVAKLQAVRPEVQAILVTGPLMAAGQRATLVGRATDRIRVITHADNIQLMACADAVVSMGGYNSVFEALRLARPLVIVPRANHKVEQKIRAEALAARGIARCVLPTELAGDKLLGALEWALSRNAADQARLVAELVPSFDGASRLTEFVGPWLALDAPRRGPVAAPVDVPVARPSPRLRRWRARAAPERDPDAVRRV